jgi:hypothetical protein
MRSSRFRPLVIFLLFGFMVVPDAPGQSPPRVVHVFVALADNVHQGIVPVPAKLGNGADPEHNLYWGAAGGVKTFFARSVEWRLVSQQQRPKPEILERCVFQHRTANVYLVADAYRGDRIQQAIMDFLEAAAGVSHEPVTIRGGTGDKVVAAAGDSKLVAYVGHDGLMDFQLPVIARPSVGGRRDAIVLACASKAYFAALLRSAGARPLLWTTGLMAPEAYTLKSALDGWILEEKDGQIRERAAVAYDKYQKCGLKGARRLLVSGW